MKFTLSWLKDHLETTASLEEITKKLVDVGLEVEEVINPGAKLANFVVGHVVECGRHPNADRLSLCQVDAGSGELIQVVCGATNVRKDMKVVFASVGTVIPETGQPLKKGVIRDIESCGMLCSARELELGQDHDGIIDLDTDLPAGTPAAIALNLTDPVIDISITPNRSDCFGVRGIARDLAAAGLGTLKPLPYHPHVGTFSSPITVNISDSSACPDFRGVYIKGVKNKPSPTLIQQRLSAVGLRPISALVDVTNYLSIDLCRPLHVFDADKIQGNLTVRLSKTGESLKALNDKEYTLNDAMTVVCDDKEVLALAGVMGGQATGCSDSTQNVFIECAAFDTIRTANTGRTLQILSDARTRFERGVDPESLDYGLNAAINLLKEWCGGEVSLVTVGVHKTPQIKQDPTPITLTQAKIDKLSGCCISLKQAATFLERLGFMVNLNSDSLTAITPSHRFDIHASEDLVEEILRLYGYDNIPGSTLPPLSHSKQQSMKKEISKRALATRGLAETITWSFIDEKQAEVFGGQDDSLKLINPISQDLSTMRPSLLPNLIAAAVRNHNRGISSISLFEVGPQFGKQQQLVACGLRSGPNHQRHWQNNQRDFDVYDAKGDVVAMFNALGVNEASYQVEAKAPDYYHPGRSGCLKQGNKILAYFGELHPKLGDVFDTTQRMVGFEVFLDALQEPKMKKAALSLSPYQPVTRDFAFLVKSTIAAETIAKAILKVDRSLITKADIFDVYQGDKLEDGTKSIAVEVRLEPSKGTLTESDLTDITSKIITAVEKTTGGTLRQ